MDYKKVKIESNESLKDDVYICCSLNYKRKKD